MLEKPVSPKSHASEVAQNQDKVAQNLWATQAHPKPRKARHKPQQQIHKTYCTGEPTRNYLGPQYTTIHTLVFNDSFPGLDRSLFGNMDLKKVRTSLLSMLEVYDAIALLGVWDRGTDNC